MGKRETLKNSRKFVLGEKQKRRLGLRTLKHHISYIYDKKEERKIDMDKPKQNCNEWDRLHNDYGKENCKI